MFLFPIDWTDCAAAKELTNNVGRWFIGMFVNDSDHVKNRITARDLTGSVKKY